MIKAKADVTHDEGAKDDVARNKREKDDVACDERAYDDTALLLCLCFDDITQSRYNMAVLLPPHFMVLDAMIAAVNDTDNFNAQSLVVRIAEDIFEDDFDTCMDESHSDLELDFKMFSALASAQGQIHLLSGVKKRIKAFVQWMKDKVCLGHNLTSVPFPIVDTANHSALHYAQDICYQIKYVFCSSKANHLQQRY